MIKQLFLYAVQILVHPIDCCYFVKKERDQLPYIYGLMCLILAAVCRVFSVYGTSYPLNQNLPEESSLLILLGTLLLPGISWIVGAYSTTTLLNGESSFRELFTLGCLCYVPYIVITPFQIVLSHVMSGKSAILYGTIGAAAVVWVIILEFLCFMRANDYPFGKAAGVALVSLIVVLLIWAFILLSLVFIYQVIIFIKEVILEIRSQMIA